MKIQKRFRGFGIAAVVVLAFISGIYTYFNGTFWAKASAEKQMQTTLDKEFSTVKFHQIGGVWYNFKSTSYGATIVFDQLPSVKYFYELHNGKVINEGTNTLHAPVPIPYSTNWVTGSVIATPSPIQGVSVTGLTTGIGAVSSTDLSFDKQKYSFTATVTNQTNQTVQVTSIKIQLPEKLKSHVLSGNQTIVVNMKLPANGYASVSGYFILDTKGMTKPQIINLGSIQTRDFTVYVK